MKTFGQVITEARKKAGLTQKEVAGRLKREDGRVVDAPYLNAMEHYRRYPPSNYLIDQLAEMLGGPADLLYFHKRDVDNYQVEPTRLSAKRSKAPRPAAKGNEATSRSAWEADSPHLSEDGRAR